MGYRTVVVFNNDQAGTWEKDPDLGAKIAQDMFRHNDNQYSQLESIGGRVIECAHADMQTLAVLDGYEGKPLAYTQWNRGQTEEVRNLALLKNLADKMGYRISKKPKAKK